MMRILNSARVALIAGVLLFGAACTSIPRGAETAPREVCGRALENMRTAGVVTAAGGTHWALLLAANFMASATPGVNVFYATSGLMLSIAGESELGRNKGIWMREGCASVPAPI